MRRGKRMNLGHVGGERGRDNRTQGRGSKPRETPGNKGGETRGEASIETLKEKRRRSTRNGCGEREGDLSRVGK